MHWIHYTKIECYQRGCREESIPLPPISSPLFLLTPTKTKSKICPHLLIASVCGYNEPSLSLFQKACWAPCWKKISLTMVACCHGYLWRLLWWVLWKTPYQRGCNLQNTGRSSPQQSGDLVKRISTPLCLEAALFLSTSMFSNLLSSLKYRKTLVMPPQWDYQQ